MNWLQDAPCVDRCEGSIYKVAMWIWVEGVILTTALSSLFFPMRGGGREVATRGGVVRASTMLGVAASSVQDVGVSGECDTTQCDTTRPQGGGGLGTSFVGSLVVNTHTNSTGGGYRYPTKRMLE